MSQSNEFQQASKDPANAFHITPTHTEHQWLKAKDVHGKERIVKSNQQVVVNQKRRTIIVPSDNVVPAAFSGSTVYSDFTIPSTTHVLNKAVLEFTIKNGHSGALAHYPAAHLIDHIEVFSGSTVIEYITRHQIYLESHGFIQTQEHTNKAADLGETSAYAAASAVAAAATATLRIRLKSVLDSCNGLFISGFRDEIKYRIHWASSGGATNGDKFSLSDAQLALTEHLLPDYQYQQQMKVHRNNNASYRCVVRNQQDASFATFSNTSSNLITLNALRGMTAALFVAVQGQNSSSPQNYDAIGELQLKQSDGTKMTEVQSGSYILRDVAADMIKDTGFFQTANKSFYPIPFAIGPVESINTGVQSGYTHLDSKERLEVKASAASQTDKTVYVIQYAYAELRCTKGKLEVMRS